MPLSRIGQLLEADEPSFAETVERIDSRLRDEIERLEASRKQIAQLAAGDSLVLPPEVVAYLGRLRELGVSARMVAAERDGWILVAARWPRYIPEVMPMKFAQLEDPQIIRLYRLASELLETDEVAHDDPRPRELADIMAAGMERASASGETLPDEVASDDLSFDLLDALALESDPRVQRLLDLLRERGWARWTRSDRLESRRASYTGPLHRHRLSGDPARLRGPGQAGCHSSTRLPSGSVTQPNRPTPSISCGSPATSAPLARNWASIASRSRTRKFSMACCARDPK